MVLLFLFERGIGRGPHYLVLYSSQGREVFFVSVFLCENLMVRIDMLIREYRDFLRLLDRLEVLEMFRAMRGLALIIL